MLLSAAVYKRLFAVRLGTGLTLVPSYCLLSTEVIFQKHCHFQILQTEKAIIPNEVNFLSEEC